MDPNRIFNLFEQTEFDTPLEKKAKVADELLNFQDTPTFWLGMFKKLILNNQNFFHKLLISLPENLVEDLKHLDEVSELVVFLRSWYYISKVDIKRQLDKDSIKLFSGEELETCLKLSINFFEGREEYEKCAHIKKILDYSHSV
jgi:hypothetical protein